MGNYPSISTYAAEISTPPNNQETGVFRNVDTLKALIDVGKKGESTWEFFKKSSKRGPKRPCLGLRATLPDGSRGEFQWLTYSEILGMAEVFGSYLKEKDLCPVRTFDDEQVEGAKKLKALGIFMPNRPEWFISEYGATSQSISLVPLYETLGEEAMDHIVKQVELKSLVVSPGTFDTAIQALKKSSFLTELIVVGELSPQQLEVSTSLSSLTIHRWEDIMATPVKHQPDKQSADTVNTICFTSGTTGMPKGVVLTNRNVVSCIRATNLNGPLAEGEELELRESDVVLSYLPLAHVFERCVCSVVFYVGGAIGCYSGDMLKLMDDISELSPTVFVSVPRLFNRINDKITAGVTEKSYIVQSLFSWGLSSKINKFRKSACVTSTVWDTVVFPRFKSLLGDRLRFMVSGGAPLDPKVHEQIQACFGAPLLQGYGMSETMGPAFLCSHNDTVVGHVGGVYSSLEYKLQAVPDLGYFTDKATPEGELLLKGNSVTSGYFRNAEANAECFTEDGWLRTGDICVILPSNGIKIIDRKKNLFKLAQGEYVAPERVENTLGNSPFVNQIFCHGTSTEAFLVGVIVVDHDRTKAWAAQNGLEGKDVEKLCEMQEFKSAVVRDLAATGTSGGLNGFEKIRNVKCIDYEFTVANNLLTPTSKLKRAVAQRYFADAIEAMYAEGPMKM